MAEGDQRHWEQGLRGRDQLRRVYPNRFGQSRRFGDAIDEPHPVSGKGVQQHRAPGLIDSMSAAVVDVFGGVQSDPGMMMLTVVPIEKGTAKLMSVLKAAESFWELRPILQGLKLCRKGRRVVKYSA